LCRTFTAQEHLGLLDEALASEFGINGARPPEGQPAPQYQQLSSDQIAAQVYQRIQQQTHANDLELGLREAQSEKDAWIAEKNPEFLPWVKQRMATMLETAARDDEEMSFEDAYDAACRTHPEVRKILAQREEAARAQPSAVQRSRRAAVSL